MNVKMPSGGSFPEPLKSYILNRPAKLCYTVSSKIDKEELPMSDWFGKETPKLGFGLMRLPKKDI